MIPSGADVVSSPADQPINFHGDMGIFLAQGCGSDIASQRADDLDLSCIEFLHTLRRPMAIDIACGVGGQAARMARAGATVLAVDHYDFSREVQRYVTEHAVQSRVRFLQRDMRDLDSLRQQGIAHAVICQRAIHYLTFQEAAAAVQAMGRMLRENGLLFISASGLGSELGDGYSGSELALCDRHCELAAPMQAKHGIHGRVCLYSVAEMRELLQAAGMIVRDLYASPFGNVKAVARLG